MTVRRVMGTETEYGISVPGQPAANPMVASSQIVNAYASRHRSPATGARLGLRGGVAAARRPRVRPGRDVADPSQLTDEDLGLANVILTNGARLYVDHAHPEYSTPEVTNPRDVVLWDKAGERVMAEAARRARQIPGSAPIQLYKNNTDNKGASYGTHENYLMRRRRRSPTSCGTSRRSSSPGRWCAGPGRVGIGQDGREHGFQISQRADFFEVEVGLETTLKRPIINTRDEPHADPEKYRRLHVIIGDANLAEMSTYLKVGTTALVLAMIEDGVPHRRPRDRCSGGVAARGLARPDAAHLVTMRDGRRLTAVQLQMEYLEQARKYVEDRYGADVDDVTADVLERWESVLSRLEDDPMSLSRELDWVAKLALLEGYRDRDGLDWDAPRLQLVDLQYADVRPDKGLYNRLVRPGGSSGS